MIGFGFCFGFIVSRHSDDPLMVNIVNYEYYNVKLQFDNFIKTKHI